MDRQHVDSSMIVSIGYDSQASTLEIEFKNGGSIWQYFEVPEYVYNELMIPSHGKYFIQNIRGSYSENRVG